MATDADKVAMLGLSWVDCGDIVEYDFKSLELNCKSGDNFISDAVQCLGLESGNEGRKSCTVGGQNSPQACGFLHIRLLQSSENL